MNFLTALAAFIGRNVEVYQTGQLITGELVAVGVNSFVVNVVANSYEVPVIPLTVFQQNVEFVRILPA